MESIEPRAYQEAIFETAKKHNTLVVLPTGLGKTLPAVILADYRLKEFPSTKILILAPTRPLAAQWLDYFKKYSSNKNKELHLFTGKINALKRKEIWKIANVVLSTPQCISNDLKNKLIDLENVNLLVEDECHRCVKNYAYTYVVEQYLKQAKNPRVLGLTASPSSDSKTIKQICKNLGIEKVEIRTRDSEDVKPYLQKLTREIIKVELPSKIKEIIALLKGIHKKRIEELKNRKLLFGRPTKINILEMQKRFQKMIATGNRHFNILRGISVCAQIIKLSHALELLETQGIETSYSYLNDLYEQARQKKSKAVTQLVNTKEFQDAYLKLAKLFKAKEEHPKLEKLKEIIKQELERKKDLKAIIFSQYRNSVNKINNELTKLNIKSKIFIGQAKRKFDGMSQKEQQLILHEFKQGDINCLVATSVGEEGIDISEVDLVVFYEPIPSAIRTIQRRGRTARLKPGKLIILMAKGTRDESHHWAAYYKERKMYGALENLKHGLKQGIKKDKKKQKKISEF